MPEFIEETKRPWQATAGEVIVRHPHSPSVTGEWMVTGRPWRDGWYTQITVATSDGGEQVFVLEPGQMITVRGEAEGLLTDEERDEAFAALSTDDCGHIVAHVASQHPAVFDAALAAFAAYRTRLEAAS